MSEPTRSWKDVLSDEPVNQARAAIYERLMDAQERIARARHEGGVDHAVIRAALDQAMTSFRRTIGARISTSRPWNTTSARWAANSRCGRCSLIRP